MLAGSAAGELVNWVETVWKLLFVHLKIISHFGTPCIYCSGRSRRGRSKPACTLLRLPPPPQVGATEKRSEMALGTILLQKLY
jgi:hypothetical protein